jgi:hypothetical protein
LARVSKHEMRSQQLVMPGHSSLLCADGVNLAAMPGIHVFLSDAAKTWMAGTSPAMTAIKSIPHRFGMRMGRARGLAEKLF